MNIETLAQLYVSTIEPVLKFIGLSIVVIFLLYLLNLVRDGKKKSDLINSAFSFIIKLITGIFTWSGRAILWFIKFSAKIITVIFAAIRDFFTSKL